MKTSNSGRTSIPYRLVGVCNGQIHCAITECFVDHDETCEHSKPTDQKPIWEDEFNEKFPTSVCMDHNKQPTGILVEAKLIKQFISQVEKAAYERGKSEGYIKGYEVCEEEHGI